MWPLLYYVCVGVYLRGLLDCLGLTVLFVALLFVGFSDCLVCGIVWYGCLMFGY